MQRSMGLNSERVGRDNLSSILRRVHVAGPQSRSDLAALTGLNRSTIGSLVQQLAVRRLVEEGRVESTGGPGRPSYMVRARPDTLLALALDIEVDSLGLAVVGLGGVPIRTRRIPRVPRASSPVQTVAQLVEATADLLDADALERLVGIGVAVVGLVRRSDGSVRLAPNLNWRDVPLAEMVRDGLGLRVPVEVGNEADLGGFAEHLRGAAVGADNVIYLSGEVGLGGGVIVQGRPLIGAGGYAGEIGHMLVNVDGMRCGCGADGCWETEVGEAALIRAAGGRAAGPRHRIVNRIVAEAASGDPSAITAVEHVGRWVGIGLSGLVNAFNPNVIVLGGLFARLYPFIEPVVRAELELRATAAAREGLALRPGRYGADGPLYGAAELAFEAILADPTLVPEISTRAARRPIAGAGQWTPRPAMPA